MIIDYLKQINWIDIFVIITLLRITYISLKRGFPIEIFKLLGTVCAIFLACHYYIRLGIFLNKFISLSNQSGIDFLNFFSFLMLYFLGYGSFVLIRLAFTALIRMEAISLLNRWGAFILGMGRWGLLVSVIFFSISISNFTYFKHSLKNSLSGLNFFKLTPRVYLALWDNFMFRFINNEEFNNSLFLVEQQLTK